MLTRTLHSLPWQLWPVGLIIWLVPQVVSGSSTPSNNTIDGLNGTPHGFEPKHTEPVMAAEHQPEQILYWKGHP